MNSTGRFTTTIPKGTPRASPGGSPVTGTLLILEGARQKSGQYKPVRLDGILRAFCGDCSHENFRHFKDHGGCTVGTCGCRNWYWETSLDSVDPTEQIEIL